MDIKEYHTYAASEILPLYASMGWCAYTDHPDALQNGFEHSLLTLAAYENNALIGLIRLVGDGHTVVLIQDLLVHPDHQRKGVGSALLHAALDRFYNVRQILLMTDDTPKTIAFYEKQGFCQMKKAGCCGFLRL